MFTGIIEDLGRVRSLQKGRVYKLAVESALLSDQKPGASICVNGACLTISAINGNTAAFDITGETLKCSTLGALKSGDRVNLERALAAGDRFGGHFVTGHVDCVGNLIASGALRIQVPVEYMKLIVIKGSVAVDGVSLTVAEIGTNDFAVCLIPHTIKNSTLGFRKAGYNVNVEFDALGKYVLRLKEEEMKKSNITEKFLKERGFS